MLSELIISEYAVYHDPPQLPLIVTPYRARGVQVEPALLALADPQDRLVDVTLFIRCYVSQHTLHFAVNKVQFINLLFRVFQNILNKIKRSSNNTYDVKSSFASALKLNKKSSDKTRIAERKKIIILSSILPAGIINKLMN